MFRFNYVNFVVTSFAHGEWFAQEDMKRNTEYIYKNENEDKQKERYKDR